MAEYYGGVDVGGARKGFDVAIIAGTGGLIEHGRLGTPRDVRRALDQFAPNVVAIDSPSAPGPEGERSRHGERLLVAAVGCNIRWTPDRVALEASEYYAWIVSGLALYDELGRGTPPWELIECFPTASWTRWCGPRAGRRRSRWTRQGLAGLGMEGVPARTNQDLRDAIAAAVTAFQSARRQTDKYGDIEVPSTRPRFHRPLGTSDQT